VINPPWNVPSSIAERELLPREEREPGYLESHGFVQVSDEGGTRLQQTASPQSAPDSSQTAARNDVQRKARQCQKQILRPSG